MLLSLYSQFHSHPLETVTRSYVLSINLLTSLEVVRDCVSEVQKSFNGLRSECVLRKALNLQHSTCYKLSPSTQINCNSFCIAKLHIRQEAFLYGPAVKLLTEPQNMK